MNELFELTVISFDHVVQILHLAMFHGVRQLSTLLELVNRDVVGEGLIRADRLGLLLILQSVHSFSQKTLGSLGIPGRRQVEINCISGLTGRPIVNSPGMEGDWLAQFTRP